MSTPPGSGGGWEPQGWQSRWQQPQQPPPQQRGNWQQTPDGQWVQVGGYVTNGKATAALVLGILGFVLCPFVCSIAALVLGYQARSEIDGSGGRMGGRSNATAGIVLGWIGVALCVLGVIAFVALVSFAGDSGSTISTTPA